MQRGLRGTIIVTSMASAVCACGPTYRPGPAGSVKTAAIVDVQPARERYQYRAPALAGSLHARRVELRLHDPRAPIRRDTASDPVLRDATGDIAIEVSLHRDFQAQLEPRLAALADGDPGAPAISVQVQVEHVLAFRRDNQRSIVANLRVSVASEQGQLWSGGHGSANHTLSGAPYDAAELDALHLGTCLEALDAALFPQALEQIQRELQQQQHTVPAQASL